MFKVLTVFVPRKHGELGQLVESMSGKNYFMRILTDEAEAPKLYETFKECTDKADQL